MEENNKHSQLELFQHSKENLSSEQRQTGQFFRDLRKFERTILFSIAFIIVGIIAFSLGVEKGKTLTTEKNVLKLNLVQDKPIVTNLKIQKEDIVKPVKQEALKIIESNKTEQPTAIQELSSGYTIQLASFSKQESAKKEAEKLKAKGFSPIIMQKKGYTILCVGQFKDREKAKVLLSQLKKQYSDCFIRRL